MTQEEKLLLLKDLSARLVYGVVVNYKEGEYDWRRWKIKTLYAPDYSKSGTLIDTDNDGWIGYEEYEGAGMSTGSAPLHLGKVLPYLRPMSSMTEEEKEEYDKTFDWDYDVQGTPFDWLNEHHFDFRNLIGKGLALEAPEDMYKTE